MHVVAVDPRRLEATIALHVLPGLTIAGHLEDKGRHGIVSKSSCANLSHCSIQAKVHLGIAFRSPGCWSTAAKPILTSHRAHGPSTAPFSSLFKVSENVTESYGSRGGASWFSWFALAELAHHIT